MTVLLTDRFIKALKPAPKGTRQEYRDAAVPCFGVRVTDRGVKSFFVLKLAPGARNKTRLTIGRVGAVTLKEARETARKWLAAISVGDDPRAAVRNAEDMMFPRFLETYITERLTGQRTARVVARDLRREFGTPWRHKRIDEIEPSDVADIIRAAARRGATYQARNLLVYVRLVFGWAVSIGKLKYSPCATIKPGALLGDKVARSRSLTDEELSKVWHGAGTMGYPYAPIYQLLILTGLRLNEVTRASWPEFDLENRLWTISSDRMKAERDHTVPLCDGMVSILTALPRWHGDYLFSLKSGTAPANIGSDIKKRINKIVGFDDWVNHDIRRTVRTNLSRLPIEEHVRELMVAHTRKGIAGVYDRHSYLDEKRAGFELWCARLQEIVKQHPAPQS